MKGQPLVVRSPIDWSTLAEATRGPDADKQWCSIGIVTADDAGQIVQFREDLGQPLVSVTLVPTNVPTYCRVGSAVAGNGEGEWHPFVLGDEVVVLIPQGHEGAGCVIVSRLNNKLDAFPMDSVAGQDPTTNTFAFSRRRTPYVQEYAGPVVLRSALSSALISIDALGAITLKDSENAALQLSADLIGFVGPSDAAKGTSPEFLLQLDLTHRHFAVQVGDAVMTLSASDASPEVNTITVPGAMTIGTLGNGTLEHAATTESVANVLEKFTQQLALIIGATGAGTGTAIGTAITTWLVSPSFPAVWALANEAPIGSQSPSLPEVIASIFAASTQKSGLGPTQLDPGIGCAGLVIG